MMGSRLGNNAVCDGFLGCARDVRGDHVSVAVDALFAIVESVASPSVFCNILFRILYQEV
jgi:hypothetical protein